MTVQLDSERDLAGQLIGGKYQLVRRIDEGGMGTVWEAKNPALDALVAIKLIRPELVGSGAAERLANEARILASLEHPAVIRVFDCGETSHGAPYIVMELLRGECLADTLDRSGKIDAARTVALLLPIVDAVRAAHDSGIVHRDVKPENIYLADVGGGRIQPKVLDFGIARSAVSTNLRLTTDGSLLGSPQYMSPEQARGQGDVDSRTDVWALSVVLYECISGVSPYEGENYNATLRMIIESEPPALDELTGADPLLSSIVERGLRKNREDRWPGMNELGAALAQWLFSQGVTEDATGVALRASWLASDLGSIPPVTTPVTAPEPERVAASPAAARGETPASGTAYPSVVSEPRLSTAGVSHTFEAALRRPRRARALMALALAVVVGAGAVKLLADADADVQAQAPRGRATLGAAAPPSFSPTPPLASAEEPQPRAEGASLPKSDEATTPRATRKPKVTPPSRRHPRATKPRVTPQASRSVRDLKDPY
jgi:serine/threonine-protein kinase